MGRSKQALPWGKIIQRKDQNCAAYWYWKYYDRERGYQCKRSTGTDDEKEAFAIALQWAIDYLNGNDGKNLSISESGSPSDQAPSNPAPPEEPPVMNIDTAARLYLSDIRNSISPAYYETIRIHLRGKIIPFFGEALSISEIRPMAIGRLRNHLMNDLDLKPQTINKVLTHLSQVLKFCADNEWLDSLPYIKRLPEQRRQHGYELSDEQIAALLDGAAAVSDNALRYVALGLFCGLRHGEAVRVRWSDIDWENNIIILEKQKNRSAQPAPLGNARKILERQKNNDWQINNNHRMASPSVERTGTIVKWIGHDSKGRSVMRCTKTWKTVKRFANQIIESYIYDGIEESPIIDDKINDKDAISIEQRRRLYIPDSFRYHDLRHTFISRMFRILGYDARHLSRHSSSEAFIKYLHSDSSEFLKRAGEAFPQIDGIKSSPSEGKEQ